MLKHGENIIDTLGAEVDRLEKGLKVSLWIITHRCFTEQLSTAALHFPQQRNPEVRHVDLEIL